MNNNPIEDIIIDHHSEKKSKKGKGIIVIIVFFMIILIALYVAYWYLTSMNVESNKDLFFKYIQNSKIDFFVDNKIYQEVANKYMNNNSETETSLTFSTTMKPENMAEIDVSKFLLNLKTLNNIQTKDIYNELDISYSGNELLKIKSIANENQIAFVSDEIVNKYVGVNKENSERVLEKLNISNLLGQVPSLKEQSKIEDITFDNFIKTETLKSYIEFMKSIIAEEKFTTQSNYLLEKESSESVSVTAYQLTLTQSELNTIIKETLTKLKNDEAVLNEIAGIQNLAPSEKNSFNVVSTTNLDPVGNVTDVNLSPVEPTASDNMNLENIEANETNSEENVNYDSVQNETNSNIENIVTTDTMNTEIQESEEDNPDISITEIITAIIFGNKVQATTEDIQESITSYLNKLNQDGNGVKIIVYVSENETEKLSITLPNQATLDIELDSVSENEKNIIVTYLIEESVATYTTDNEIVYSAADNAISENTSVNGMQTNGFKLEFYKLKRDASTTIEATYNFIENKQINQKISFNIITEGTENSKNLKNEFVVMYSNNDGEFKIAIDNNIKFDITPEIEKLTDENCLFLDTLGDEELQLTIDAIREKIKYVYDMKKESLNFLDTNTQSSVSKQNTNLNMSIARENSKNALINTISGQMGEAQARGEQYTIMNLEGLQIEGHEVVVIIENDIANVTIDGFKFTIDSNFNLSEAE